MNILRRPNVDAKVRASLDLVGRQGDAMRVTGKERRARDIRVDELFRAGLGVKNESPSGKSTGKSKEA